LLTYYNLDVCLQKNKAMKKQILSAIVCTMLFGASSNAQTKENDMSIGVQFGTIEYNGDYSKEIFSFKPGIHSAIGINVAKYYSPSFDFRANLRYGMVDGANMFNTSIFDVNLLIDYKFANGYILKENSFFAPYIFLGFGDAITTFTAKNGPKLPTTAIFNLPMGVGFKFNVNPKFAITLETHYNYEFTDELDWKVGGKYDDSFLYNSLGLHYNFATGKDTDGDGVKDKNDKCPNTPENVKVDDNGCAIDTDKDGIADYLDTCPKQAGIAKFNGCPDSDNDGIKDSEDACPNLAGVASANGCPDTDGDGIKDSEDACPKVAGIDKYQGCPDTDGDGIIDSKDKCPNVAGITSMNGCPDTDGDGITDAKDKCPTIKGVASNNGCPEIKQETKDVFERALKGIQFQTGKDIIKSSSYGILNNVVSIMKENPSYKLVINGHTDSSGDDAKNMILSQKRANSVMKYLTDKGINASRLTAKGYGETKPKATNDTKAGRAENRRVEFEVKF